MGHPLFMTIEEAARVLSVSRNHVLTMVRTGKLAGVKFGRRWIIDRAAIQQLVAASAARADKPQLVVDALPHRGERAILAVLGELRKKIAAIADDLANVRHVLSIPKKERGTDENQDRQQA